MQSIHQIQIPRLWGKNRSMAENERVSDVWALSSPSVFIACKLCVRARVLLCDGSPLVPLTSAYYVTVLFVILDLIFKDVCTGDSLGWQRQCLPLEQGQTRSLSGIMSSSTVQVG